MNPSLPEPTEALRPESVIAAMAPSRNAAMQRRAMQAAMATAVRALRSGTDRRGRRLGSYGAPPAAR